MRAASSSSHAFTSEDSSRTAKYDPMFLIIDFSIVRDHFERWSTNPNRGLACVFDPRLTPGRSEAALEDGELTTVTFAVLSNAINRLAWHLDALLTRRHDLETVAYIGPSDIRYYIFACAACKFRVKVGRYKPSSID
ncbi:hypothetical protein L1887_47948 [Cichorium endivia]|nr:hypothetical protein L1887_47948 [Cichorium endivia]